MIIECLFSKVPANFLQEFETVCSGIRNYQEGSSSHNISRHFSNVLFYVFS